MGIDRYAQRVLDGDDSGDELRLADEVLARGERIRELETRLLRMQEVVEAARWWSEVTWDGIDIRGFYMEDEITEEGMTEFDDIQDQAFQDLDAALKALAELEDDHE